MAKDGMMGEGGMSPRKGMASGKLGTGGHESFGVSNIQNHRHEDGQHPDAKMSHDPLEDHERGIGHAIKHHEHHHPAQASPHHGPGHVEGYAMRHGKGHEAEHKKHAQHHHMKPGHPGHAGRHHKGHRGK